METELKKPSYWLNTTCKNKNCTNKFKYNIFWKVKHILYCGEPCWIEDWKSKGYGLVHRKFPNVPVKDLKANEVQAKLNLLKDIEIKIVRV